MGDWKDEVRKRLAAEGLEPGREAEVVEELAQHLEDCYRDALAGGATPEDARRAALEELSGAESLADALPKSVRAPRAEPPVLGAQSRGALADIAQDVR